MNISGLMKQAQEMQKKIQDIQNSLAEMVEEGSSGAGMVVIKLNGKNEVQSIKIDPELIKVDEKEILEDLLIAAFNDAKRKIDLRTESEMTKVTGKLGLPANMKLPF